MGRSMGRLRQYVYLAPAARRRAGRRGSRRSRRPTPSGRRSSRRTCCSPSARSVQDLLTQLAVSVQGYLALDLIRRNNLELIKGVDRATTTTVSALRTAVIVAQALADQKLVLDQITALNTTTVEPHRVDLARCCASSRAQINEQAASATVELEKLQAAFTNIYATMDEIDTFKVKALDNMQKTVTRSRAS